MIGIYQLEFVNLTFRANARDYRIMKLLGASRGFLRGVIFGESAFAILFGGFIALSLNLIFDSTFMAVAYLPPITTPILIMLIIVGMFSIVNWITTLLVVNHLR